MSNSMDELSKAEFETAARMLREMTEEEFERAFADLVGQMDEYDEETDAFLLQFAVDEELGIEKWRMQHFDMSREGNLWDKQKFVRDFEKDAGGNALGANTFNVRFVQGGAPSRENLQAALYTAFRQAAQSGSPSYLLMNPEVQMEVEATGDSFSISYRP